jgi:hypothetical protein
MVAITLLALLQGVAAVIGLVLYPQARGQEDRRRNVACDYGRREHLFWDNHEPSRVFAEDTDRSEHFVDA